jgi:pyruvate formate lyase activating enzyme
MTPPVVSLANPAPDGSSMNNDKKEPQGNILDIQRLSTEDGPGIRTTIFFKGCSLKCAWCHNPESISSRPQVHWILNRCIGCGTCSDVCPEGALSRSAAGLEFDREACTGCGECAAECPAAAIEQLGEGWLVSDLLAEVIKDRAYFETSGGGVTIGGGEPLLQPDFAAALLKRLNQQGIHTAVDTCGHCSAKAFRAILPQVDLILFDLKQIDPDLHTHFTGAGNQQIIANLEAVAAAMKVQSHPRELWIRTPVIPGATDSDENVSGIGRLIADRLGGHVQRWELLAFNHLCRDKYLRLGLRWEYDSAELLTADRMEGLARTARASGVDPSIVHWSGSTRVK